MYHPLLRDPSRKVLRVLLLISVNLAVFFVLAELCALGFYALRDGELHYRSRARLDEPAIRGADALTSYRLHPYFGYCLEPGFDRDRKVVRNNYGFQSRIDVPYSRRSDQELVVAVFGGSLAEGFAVHGIPWFTKRLKEQPQFADRTVTVLNFAAGGYKQPQQLLVLATILSLGQEIDLAIAIDGFNEMAVSWNGHQQGLHYAMPCAGHILPLAELAAGGPLTRNRLDSLRRIERLRDGMAVLAAWANGTNLAFADLVLGTVHRFLHARYTRAVAEHERFCRLDDASLVRLEPAPSGVTMPVVLERCADLWAESVRSMHDLLAARGVPAYFFIQPNQYYSDKPFLESEAKRALDPSSPSPRILAVGYPLLQARVERLARAGIRARSAVELFDGDPREVYLDTCCHLNARGNRVLAEYVADAIVAGNKF